MVMVECEIPALGPSCLVPVKLMVLSPRVHPLAYNRISIMGVLLYHMCPLVKEGQVYGLLFGFFVCLFL